MEKCFAQLNAIVYRDVSVYLVVIHVFVFI